MHALRNAFDLLPPRRRTEHTGRAVPRVLGRRRWEKAPLSLSREPAPLLFARCAMRRADRRSGGRLPRAITERRDAAAHGTLLRRRDRRAHVRPWFWVFRRDGGRRNVRLRALSS